MKLEERCLVAKWCQTVFKSKVSKQKINQLQAGLGVLHYTFRIRVSVGTFQNAIHSLKEECYSYSKRWWFFIKKQISLCAPPRGVISSLLGTRGSVRQGLGEPSGVSASSRTIRRAHLQAPDSERPTSMEHMGQTRRQNDGPETGM